MNQYVTIDYLGDQRFVASRSSDQFIRTVQNFLDVLAWGGENKTNLFELRDTNFVAEFYDLKTGLAGEVLQKVSNYGARLAIVGTFDMVMGERFRELMSESNRGSQIRFAQDREEAIQWLMGKSDSYDLTPI